MSTLRVNTVRNAAGSAPTDASQLGVGQTWQAVTRSAGVPYLNDTGRPIVFSCSFSSPFASASVSATINGVGPIAFGSVGSGTGPCGGAGSIIIPVGATYTFTFFSDHRHRFA